MKKIFLIFMFALLCTQLVLASSVTRSFSKTTLEAGESLNVILNVSVSGGDTFYAIDESLPSTAWTITANGGGDTTQAGHLKWVVVSGATSTSYTYIVTAPSTPGVYTFSGTYGFDDGITHDISGSGQVTISGSGGALLVYNVNAVPTSSSSTISWNTNLIANSSVNYGKTTSLGSVEDSSSLVTSHSLTLSGLDSATLYYYKVKSCDSTNCTESELKSFTTLSSSAGEEDSMVNYIRGKITLDGVAAAAGTNYKVEIISGVNDGYIYSGSVDDSKMYSVNMDNGYFDTGDQIGFSTGDGFKVTVLTATYTCTSSEGIFENGGNGDFNDPTSLIVLTCTTTPQVNHPPVLSLISDKTVEEGQNVTITASATDSDGDSITYSINDTKFTGTNPFVWQTDDDDAGVYYVLITATDSRGLSDTQQVKITVTAPNQPPVLADIPPITRDEDSGFYLDGTLSATDPDGTISRFAITYENASQVHCVISDSRLGITPSPNFAGDAICKVRAYDNLGLASDEKTVNIHISNINDAPIITSSSPNFNPVYLHLNESKLFSITWTDIDSPPANVLVNWSENGENKGIENSYTFGGKSDEGQYNVSVKVSDELNTTTKTWQVIVAEMFTCSMEGGHICSSSQICSGTLTNVSDTSSCCIGSCTKAPPSFDDLSRCDVKDSRVKINFNDPEDGDDFEVGEVIDGEIEIENNYDQDQDFNLKIYLYDADEDDKLVSVKEDVDVDAGESEDVEFEIEIPDDLEEDGDYYIFVKADDEICNEGYIKLNIEQKDHNIVLNNVYINPETVSPGSNIEVSAEVENFGTDDDEVYIRVESSQLGLSEQSQEFEVAEGEDEKLYLNIKIPTNTPDGTYTLKISAVSSGDEDSQEISFNVAGTGSDSGGGIIIIDGSGTLVPIRLIKYESGDGGIVLYPSDSDGTSSGGTKLIPSGGVKYVVGPSEDIRINLGDENKETEYVKRLDASSVSMYLDDRSGKITCINCAKTKSKSLFEKSSSWIYKKCLTLKDLLWGINAFLIIGIIILFVLAFVLARRR